MATYHNYYEPFSGFHDKINDACSCIASNGHGTVASEVEGIMSSISSINTSGYWDDAVGQDFAQVKESFVESLKTVLTSINGTWSTTETMYTELQQKLQELSDKQAEYDSFWKRMPNEDDYRATIITKDNNGNQTGSYQITTPEYYRKLAEWNKENGEYLEAFQTIIDGIKSKAEELASKGSERVSVGDLETIENLSSIMTIFADAITGNPMRLQELLELYGGRGDPNTTRLSQGLETFGKIPFGRSNIHDTGCGVMAIVMALNAELKKIYDEDLIVYPDEMLNALYALGDGRNSKDTYYRGNGVHYTEEAGQASKITTDITAAFPEICVIEFVYNGSGVFNKQQLQYATDNGTVAESLNGLGHFSAILSNDGNGNFYVGDPGGYYKDITTPISINTGIKNGSGTIDAKKGFLFIDRSKVTKTDDGFIVDGMDLSQLPKIAAIEMDGNAYCLDGSKATVV